MEDVEEVIEFTSTKRKVNYRLVKDPRGYPFYFFTASKSDIPRLLQGRFSSKEAALRQFEYFERSTKETHAVRSEELQRFREERRGQSRTES
jgi:hypothetical protein